MVPFYPMCSGGVAAFRQVLCCPYPLSSPQIIPGGFVSACSNLQPQHFSPIPLSKNKPSANGRLLLAFYCSSSSVLALLVPVELLHELGDGAEVSITHLLHQHHVIAVQDLRG